MGEAQIHTNTGMITIRSHIITYGNAANELITAQMRTEIEDMWNEPQSHIYIDATHYKLVFIISAEVKKRYRPAGSAVKC